MGSLEHFIDIGITLSSEKNHHVLLEKILKSAMTLANADAGTIYSISNEKKLVFETLVNNTLNYHLGGTTGKPIEYPTIPVFKFGEINKNAMVAVAAASGNIINIEDAYTCSDYDFSAAKDMDKITGYRTKSVLTLPMKNHQQELNGVIQLINACDENGQVIPFSEEKQRIIHALTSFAAIIITNKQLICEMENLFSSFSKLIASAIDKKSPYTGEHCRRVPVITMMLAKACHYIESGPLQTFTMEKEDFHELNMAAWLHDCGKVATPEYVMDKTTKLATIFDRIELVIARFEIAARDIYHSKKTSDYDKAQLLKELEQDKNFICNANIGGEVFEDKDINRVYAIAKRYQVSISGVTQAILNEDEIYNLIIKRGTINPKERKILNGHMDVTVEMLESLPFPKHLQHVPEYACGHHEKMDGTGYPKGLTRDQMSIPARMMAIADVFEALTAKDRPYKQPKTLAETLTIMGKMRLDNHLDPDLFDVFIQQKVYLEFANAFLEPTQIDEFNLDEIPGCNFN